MDGHQYEYACAKMLRKRGFANVSVTRGSGDQGIDVIAYSGGKKYGIQCKYYTSPVGNHAVQEAYAGARYYNCDIAVVMTNNTFTPSAKELAKKTNVLLWDESKIPTGTNSFWLTKFIGIFVCIVGIIGLITMWGADNIKLPALQAIELVLLIMGGIFAVFEYQNWGAAFLSSTAYLLSAFMNLIFNIMTGNLPGFDFLLFIAIFLIAFLRIDYLHNKTNGYHVWKSGFKQFVHDNFTHSRKQENKTPDRYMSREEFEKEMAEIQRGIDEVRNDLADINKGFEELEESGFYKDYK